MSPLRSATPIEVLLVEDNAADAELMQRTLATAKIRTRLHHVATGSNALAFLRRQPPYAAAPLPDLVLLDLNLPEGDGRLVLEAIRADGTLQRVPVIVVTGSTAEEDAARSARLGAHAHLVKPVDPVAFLNAINSLEKFWLAIVRVP